MCIRDRVHLIRQVREGDLRLDHPELGRMARCVGILGAEGGAEDVYKRQALHWPRWAALSCGSAGSASTAAPPFR